MGADNFRLKILDGRYEGCGGCWIGDFEKTIGDLAKAAGRLE
jgi:hypothetical protein